MWTEFIRLLPDQVILRKEFRGRKQSFLKFSWRTEKKKWRAGKRSLLKSADNNQQLIIFYDNTPCLLILFSSKQAKASRMRSQNDFPQQKRERSKVNCNLWLSLSRVALRELQLRFPLIFLRAIQVSSDNSNVALSQQQRLFSDLTLCSLLACKV